MYIPAQIGVCAFLRERQHACIQRALKCIRMYKTCPHNHKINSTTNIFTYKQFLTGQCID